MLTRTFRDQLVGIQKTSFRRSQRRQRQKSHGSSSEASSARDTDEGMITLPLAASPADLAESSSHLSLRASFDPDLYMNPD